MKIVRILFLVLVGTTVSISASAAPLLYGITGARGAASSLYTIDPLTGSTSLIGPTGFSHLTGLDFDPTTGTLYAVMNNFHDSSPTNLLTLNTTTGVGTVVGPTGHQIPDITIGPDGILRGWSEEGFGVELDNPIVINKSTGTVTVTPSSIKPFTTGVATESATSIFVKAYTSLYSVDLVTGDATLLRDLVFGMRNILENAPTGGLISGDRTGSGTQLYGIDSSTYAVTTLGFTHGVEFSALAYEEPTTSVPEPTTLLLLAVGLAGLGFGRRGARQ